MKLPLRRIGIIGIIIFIILLSQIDRSALLSLFLGMDGFYAFIWIALTLPSVALKSWKWMALLEKGERPSFLRSVEAWVCGFGAGIVTPAKVGDFFRAAFLKAPKRKAFVSVLVDRLIDILALLALGGLSAVLLFSRQDPLFSLSYIFFFLLAALFLGGVAAGNKGFMCRYFGGFYLKFMPQKIKLHAGPDLPSFYKSLGHIGKKKAALNMGLTFAAWLICFGQYWMLSKALGIGLSYTQILIAAPVIILAQLIPVSVLGLGTREGASVLLLAFFGVSAEKAIAFSLGILIQDLLLGGVGLLLLLRKGIRPKKSLQNDPPL
jgi:uncharacterized protein (TIRG00374 family)